ncbi:hypothetical protein DL766_001497 [Monosporascus sp. MC13-8B]|uniref:Myb-like domain-containing protein n=1 Tax=Monosporascus cannonballus TaxID=155416 RepID=A0ABY0H2J1_9PEZI|nr:hypothetical protein DL762_006255 [Monosporascus cannonballus]RYO99834.1 hypothetical protein DL763_001224 [Monosporascus cannonballus]RYP37503.1 hypothetical protein DL766_001497 [Monosporascus sp. MC13-8B]
MGTSASIFSNASYPANVNQPDRNPFAELNSILKIATEPFVNLGASEMPETTAVASSTPAPTAKGVKEKVKADATGKVDDGKWSPEETIKLLFLVMQHENSELAVQGWKDIGEKVQKVFDGKYSAEAAKKRFRNVRRAYIEEFPLPKKQDGPRTDTQAAPKGKAKAAAPKSRKRSAAVAAVVSGVQDSNDADGEVAGEDRAAKRAKTEKQPAAAPIKEEAQKGDATEEDAAAATSEQEKQEKPAVAKPKPKRKVPAKKTKAEKQVADVDAGDDQANVSEKPKSKAKRATAKPRAGKAVHKAESTSDRKPEEAKPEEDKPSSITEADDADEPAQDGDTKIQGGEGTGGKDQ